MQSVHFSSTTGHTVRFSAGDSGLLLESLFGLVCGNGGHDSGPRRTQGPALVCTERGRFEAGSFVLTSQEQRPNEISLKWRLTGSGLTLDSRWRFDPDTATLSRQDSLTNTGNTPTVVHRFLARIALQPASYEVYAQRGGWAAESQGAWTALQAGSIALWCEGGRTAQGAAPYACVRPVGEQRGVALHVVPCGNWVIRISARPAMNGQAYAVVEAGLADEDLHALLEPGRRLFGSELLFQPLTDGTPESAAPLAGRYALSRMLTGAKPEPPVVYNTWQDQFDNLDPERLRMQLSVVKDLGAEVFVVDAGWFGAGSGSGAWSGLTGDWTETPDRAFRGRMRQFADEVRSAGLGFGLWMEPENAGSVAPIRKENPEWFRGGGPVPPRLDLENPAAYEWAKSEICRLVETYQPVWMKIDFNTELGQDERGTELRWYYDAWYRLMDIVRAAYPQVFFEACASGGMRLDLASLSHADSHFLSDTTNTLDTIRIGEATALRAPVGRIGRWLSVRSIGHTIPDYPGTVSKAPESLAVCVAGGFQPVQLAETYGLDFAAIAAMPGVFGLSGDPSSLSVPTREHLKSHIGFYKQWRRFIASSWAYLLTPVRPMTDRTGWSVMQLRSSLDPASVVFAFRLQDSRGKFHVRLQGLEPSITYRVSLFPVRRDLQPYEASGQQLMQEGLDIEHDLPASASVTVIDPA